MHCPLVANRKTRSIVDCTSRELTHCDQIGDFWKLLVKKFVTKVDQMGGNNLSFFEKQ